MFIFYKYIFYRELVLENWRFFFVIKILRILGCYVSNLSCLFRVLCSKNKYRLLDFFFKIFKFGDYVNLI